MWELFMCFRALVWEKVNYFLKLLYVVFILCWFYFFMKGRYYFFREEYGREMNSLVNIWDVVLIKRLNLIFFWDVKDFEILLFREI